MNAVPDRPVLDQLNLVARDIDATVAFYRLLELPIEDPGGDWPPGSGARHVEVGTHGGASLEFDNVRSAGVWHRGVRDAPEAVPVVVVGFAFQVFELDS
jgi:hypothetical protein